jgi:feruloyl esterase
MPSPAVSTTLIVLSAAFGNLRLATADAGAPMACESLMSLQVANTTIVSAETVASGAFRPPVPDFPFPADYSKLPAFCRVTGSIKPSGSSDVRFELWLPAADWNGRFLQTGNGGAAGAIVYGSLAEPLARGYAVANTDTGHQGAMGDFSWAAGQPERLADYAFRAVHELTVVGKGITTARYGKPPARSYWNGCSTGGRQGLKEAQRYPNDYDAIIAGAPANNWSQLMSLSILIQRSMGAPDGLGVDKLAALKEAALAACDAKDGVQDRVIGEPRKCLFDPASLQCKAGETRQCLGAAELAAAQRIYRGVVDKAGKTLMPGTGPASEPLWAMYASPQFGIGTSYFRYVVANDPTWDPRNFDLDEDLVRAERVDGGAALAMDPNLGRFIAHGGKLLLYHGTADGLIPYGNSVNYYESVVRTLGSKRVHDNVRLYVVPGMEHCAGGDGAYQIDWLGAMEDWVERGHVPGALAATHPLMTAPPGAPPSPGRAFTRPVCAYPQVARYQGSGDSTDAASFHCVAP